MKKGIPAKVAVSLAVILTGAAFGLLLPLFSQTKGSILQVLAKYHSKVLI